MFANVNYHTLDTLAEIMAARLLKLVEEYVEGRRRSGRPRKQCSVHGQHQALDKNDEIVSQVMVANDQT